MFFYSFFVASFSRICPLAKNCRNSSIFIQAATLALAYYSRLGRGAACNDCPVPLSPTLSTSFPLSLTLCLARSVGVRADVKPEQ